MSRPRWSARTMRGLDCPGCGCRVLPGRVRLLARDGRPWCDQCTAGHGLLDALAVAEASALLADRVEAGGLDLAESAAIAHCRAAAEAWLLDVLGRPR